MTNEKTVSNYDVDHVLKQKKKDLANGHVYAVVKGKTEMHDLCKVELSALKNVELGDFLLSLVEQNKILRKVNETQKQAILLNKDRIEKLERIVERYGLK